MSRTTRLIRFASVTGVALFLAAGAAFAQQTTYDVRSGEVLAVSGNHLVVRGANGVREFVVADDFRFDMNGRQLSVHDLKPGMTLTAVIKTTETPVELRTTEVRNAEVIHTIGNSIIVRNTEDGIYRKFTTDQMRDMGLIVYRDDQVVDPATLRKGDRITATIVTKLPPTVLTQQEIAAYAREAPKPAPPPAPAASTPAPAEAPAPSLPKTGSPLPLIGLVGALALAGGVALTLRRRLARS